MKKDNKLLKELEIEKKQNSKSRLWFVRFHAEWLKHSTNRDWSVQQKRLINSQFKNNKHLKPA